RNRRRCHRSSTQPHVHRVERALVRSTLRAILRHLDQYTLAFAIATCRRHNRPLPTAGQVIGRRLNTVASSLHGCALRWLHCSRLLLRPCPCTCSQQQASQPDNSLAHRKLSSVRDQASILFAACSLQEGSQPSLIRSGSLDAVDYKRVYHCLRRFQFQPKLFLHRGVETGRRIGVVGRRHAPTHLLKLALVGGPVQLEVVAVGQPCLIQNRFVQRRLLHTLAEILHRAVGHMQPPRSVV